MVIPKMIDGIPVDESMFDIGAAVEVSAVWACGFQEYGYRDEPGRVPDGTPIGFEKENSAGEIEFCLYDGVYFHDNPFQCFNDFNTCGKCNPKLDGFTIERIKIEFDRV